MRVFLDTCVLLDIISRRSGFEESLKILVPQLFGDVELCVSSKSYTDIFFIMNKHAESSQIQDAFLASEKYFNLCSVDSTMIAEAANRKWDDFEDCLIAIGAENVAADYLLTRDANGFKNSTVPAITPNEFMHVLKDNLQITYHYSPDINSRELASMTE
jgi:predicted nucleic acid-binding protein